MRIEIDNTLLEDIAEYFEDDVGYKPNMADMEGEIENMLSEYLEILKKGEK